MAAVTQNDVHLFGAYFIAVRGRLGDVADRRQHQAFQEHFTADKKQLRFGNALVHVTAARGNFIIQCGAHITERNGNDTAREGDGKQVKEFSGRFGSRE